ncbi:hypothetical protein V8E55_008332 [Tylopilus felleus]
MTVSTELPPMGKVSMIGIWVETLLYGVNCVMYGLCMFILLRRGKGATLHWVLIVVSTILFFLGTIHVGTSLQQLLDAFVYTPANVSDYSTTYWLDYTTTLRVLKDSIYDTLIFVQYFILTWRLYVVFMCNWRVIVFPIILLVGGVGCVYTSSAMSALSNDDSLKASIKFIVSAWVIGFVHNVLVTGAIVARLWWMGRTIASLTGTPTNRFASSIYIIVESGAISVACSIVVLVLFATLSPASFASLDVIAQLSVLTPLLIVVQVGKTGSSSKTISRTLDQIRFRVEVSPEQDSESLAGHALDAILARSPSSASATRV